MAASKHELTEIECSLGTISKVQARSFDHSQEAFNFLTLTFVTEVIYDAFDYDFWIIRGYPTDTCTPGLSSIHQQSIDPVVRVSRWLVVSVSSLVVPPPVLAIRLSCLPDINLPIQTQEVDAGSIGLHLWNTELPLAIQQDLVLMGPGEIRTDFEKWRR